MTSIALRSDVIVTKIQFVHRDFNFFISCGDRKELNSVSASEHQPKSKAFSIQNLSLIELGHLKKTKSPLGKFRQLFTCSNLCQQQITINKKHKI